VIRRLLPVLLLLAACRKPAPAADVVAEARSGSVALPEVEAALGAARTPSPAASPSASKPDISEQVGRYRKAAEALVVERALLGDMKDPDRVRRELGKDYDRMRRDIVVEAFDRETQANQPIRVTEAEVAEYYKAHPSEFHRPGFRFVWLIFRRHEDAAHPEATVAFLKDLKERVRKGEPFRILARKYSHSETRLFEGRLGVIGRGRLPRPLEDVVFALPKDGVSDPVPVSGGAVMFQVTEVFEEKSFGLEDVRVTIADKLREEKRVERLKAVIAGREPPAGSVVLDREAIRRELESGVDDEVVLKVGATELTLKEFREMVAALPEDRLQSLPGPTRPERQAELYDRLVRQAILFDKLESEGYAAAAQRQRAIADQLRARARAALVRRRIEERIAKKVDADPGALRRFHEENKFLYQSPLRLKVKTLVVPARADAPRKIVEMEAARDALARGQLDLQTAAARLGGQVRDGNWVDAAAMNALDPKVRLYLLDLNGTGYTVPFQLNRQLHLVYVEKRDEPHLLPYDSVKDRVRQDYRDRKQQDLYHAVVEDVLRAEGFRFHEDVVRRALSAPAAGD
jgi:parvulin-like peptidyl-prolyl cis-trans isomerase-like protein